MGLNLELNNNWKLILQYESKQLSSKIAPILHHPIIHSFGNEALQFLPSRGSLFPHHLTLGLTLLGRPVEWGRCHSLPVWARFLLLLLESCHHHHKNKSTLTSWRMRRWHRCPTPGHAREPSQEQQSHLPFLLLNSLTNEPSKNQKYCLANA